ncbi:hypothetical protein AMAG_05792 [Allomyces macrogynus ATCC 38327]|uniref:Uncharacterized protein n=1 Tax=Allomyces macrogynus (strain ATCC 38327) TaxID=578462 RepID=A0A0L0SCY5_ALLM3|nr:hypothetical protein AMAG_05792 [Allomyces macrogynus ATCC 38327]|eukprot:KNE60403.1 hypothetical protein AMAG_05792 [Allomyces macrogynus ATCC 38327]
MAEGDTPAAVPQLPSISLPPMTPPPNPPAASSSAPPAPAPEPSVFLAAAACTGSDLESAAGLVETRLLLPRQVRRRQHRPRRLPRRHQAPKKPAQAATTAAPAAPAATSTFTPTPTPSTTWISSTVLITTESATVITGTDGATSTSSVRVTVPVVTVLPITGPSISVFQPSNPQPSLVRPSLSAPLTGGNNGYEPVPHPSGSFKGSSTGSAALPPTPAQVRAAQDHEARLHHEHIEQQHRLLYAAGDKDLPSAAHLTPPPPPMWAGHTNASDPDLSHLSLAPPAPLAAPAPHGIFPGGNSSTTAFPHPVDPMSALLMDPLAEPMFADGPYDAHDDYALPPANTPLHTSVPLPPTGPVVPLPPTSAAGLATRAEVTNLVVRPPQPPLPPMLPEYLPAPLQAPVHVPVEDQVVFAADPEAAMELLAGDDEGRPESLASRSSLYLPTADRTMSGLWDEEREM